MRGRHAEDDVVGVDGVADSESGSYGPIGVARGGHVTYFLVLFEVSVVASSPLARLRRTLADHVPPHRRSIALLLVFVVSAPSVFFPMMTLDAAERR